MGIGDLKEKLIVIGLFVGVFLPVRLLFVEYVSDHWLGSLGLISGIGVFLLVLTKKGKLGKIGRIFEKQMKKAVFGKTGKIAIILSIISIIYFGSAIIFIDRGVSVYSEDQALFYDAVIQNNSLEQINPDNLKNIQIVYESENRIYTTFDYAFSITYAIMNEFSGGWLEHLYFVLMVEQLEMLGILIFYRTFYRPELSVPA